jgi:hypothetical protein
MGTAGMMDSFLLYRRFYGLRGTESGDTIAFPARRFYRCPTAGGAGAGDDVPVFRC